MPGTGEGGLPSGRAPRGPDTCGTSGPPVPTAAPPQESAPRWECPPLSQALGSAVQGTRFMRPVRALVKGFLALLGSLSDCRLLQPAEEGGEPCARHSPVSQGVRRTSAPALSACLEPQQKAPASVSLVSVAKTSNSLCRAVRICTRGDQGATQTPE